jgi:hypothetical protein
MMRLRVEYAMAKPTNKLLAVADLDSDTWVAEVKRIRGKKLPLTAAGGMLIRCAVPSAKARCASSR